MEDVCSDDFMDVLTAAHHISDMDYHVKSAFVVEYHQELREENPQPLDDPDLDIDQAPRATNIVEEVSAEERELLEELPLPDNPISEQERRKNGSSSLETRVLR